MCRFCLIIVLHRVNIDPKIKFIFIALLLTSPMLSHYSVRSKPYIFDALVSVYILFFLINSIKSKNFKNYNLYIFAFFIFLSLTNLFSITALLIFLIYKKIIKLKNLNIHYFLLIGFSILVTYFSFQKRSDELTGFWSAYFAPTERGCCFILAMVLFFYFKNFCTVK